MRTDIAALNERVLETASASANALWVRHQWGMHEQVVEQVRCAAPEVRKRIGGCGAPLFRVRVPRDAAERGADTVPAQVGRLHLRALVAVMRAAMVDDTVAATLFGVPEPAFARLMTWPVERMQEVAYRHPGVVRPRRPTSPAFWKRLVACGRIDGPLGAHLVRSFALMGTE